MHKEGFQKHWRRILVENDENSLEGAYYEPLCSFLVGFSKQKLGRNISAKPYGRGTISETGEVSRPDINVSLKSSTNFKIGAIEVKPPNQKLDGKYLKAQFDKYKKEYSNIIFTNLSTWELWQRDMEGSPTLVCSIRLRLTEDESFTELENLLDIFISANVTGAMTPQILAKNLAKRTKRLGEILLESFEYKENENLNQLFDTIKDFLINDITPQQFASMYAETITYALFIARLQQHKVSPTKIFDSFYAIKYLNERLPEVPLLNELYTKASIEKLDKIQKQIDLIIEELNLCDIQKIEESFLKHDPDNDPILYFYEPFVKETDPSTKKQRGVFYTPKAVTDFIARCVNQILKDKFGLHDGLADETVHLLDPAAGTGTFIYSAIQEIYKDLQQRFPRQGKEFILQKMQSIINDHILDKFYGFEILIAPYAISHLKLSLLLEEYGYKFKKSDKYKRLKIFLTNTLENETNEKITKAYDSITRENELAFEVKNKKPVLAIVGNPPYSNYGKMNANKWISSLLEDYKKGLNERKINLDDDYIKFIRFAQWKIEQTGQGVFAMITNNSFIDGITHRRMRESLLGTFDEIYIYNLHGSSRKHERSPSGEKDENIFSIQQGVSINIFIKNKTKKIKSVVKYADLWGKRDYKLNKGLKEKDFRGVNWKIIDVEKFNKGFASTNWGKELGRLNFFVPKEIKLMSEYGFFYGLKDIFEEFNSGVQTKRDQLTVQFQEPRLRKIINDFKNLDQSELLRRYDLSDSSGWKIQKAIEDIKQNDGRIINYSYRPLDIRKTYYTGVSGGFVGRPRKDIMHHMLLDNIAISTTRNQEVGENNFFMTNYVSDLRFSSRPGSTGTDYVFPLFLYIDGKCKSNIKQEFLNKFNFQVKAKDVFYYIYALLFSNEYRSKYNEFLKIDFPRIPLPTNKKIFGKLVLMGKKLSCLHLMNKNPFDYLSNALSRSSKWTIKFTKNGSCLIEKMKYDSSERRIYINDSDYFEGVDKNVWDFVVGGYQVCLKWLEYRKGSVLSHNDIEHCIQMIVIIGETIKLMASIDFLAKEMLGKAAPPKVKIDTKKLQLRFLPVDVKQIFHRD